MHLYSHLTIKVPLILELTRIIKGRTASFHSELDELLSKDPTTFPRRIQGPQAFGSETSWRANVIARALRAAWQDILSGYFVLEEFIKDSGISGRRGAVGTVIVLHYSRGS